MKNIIFIVIISSILIFNSCDECRYVEPKPPLHICGNDSLRINIFDSDNVNIFESLYDIEELIILEDNDSSYFRSNNDNSLIIYSNKFSNLNAHNHLDSTLSTTFFLFLNNTDVDTIYIEGEIRLVPAPVHCAENQKDLVYYPLLVKYNGEQILKESNSTGLSCNGRIIDIFK